MQTYVPPRSPMGCPIFINVKASKFAGANVNISSYSGSTPVQAANGRGRSEMVALLIKYGAETGNRENEATKATAAASGKAGAKVPRSRSKGRAESVCFFLGSH